MLSILACGAAYALPVGNPSEASLLSDGLIWEGFCGDPCDPCLSWCDAWSFRVGFYGDYVFNRHMEVDDNNAPNRADIEHTNLNTNAAILVLNLWDRFDIFTTLGASNFGIETNARTFRGPGTTPASINGRRIFIESESQFSWSVGGRATLWECGCTTLGLEGQYFRFCPNIRRISVSADDYYSIYPDHSIRARISEWQVGLGLSHRINMFVPYIAVQYARNHIDFDENVVTLTANTSGIVNLNLYDLRNKKPWGYEVGVSLVDCEKAFVTVAGRWAGEKAVYVTGQVRF